ncbi:hypothetical protein TWF696_002081 [Orbilia brochopaga]|uniref:Uncharacterized protein n=1 Tax=Orbilia brochopaga TaxID=3140254 RepID=A0AAV9UA55_9PEZI
MPNTPLPAAVHLLQNVRYLPAGTKVRVLGCIQSYDAASGIVTLYHRPTVDVPPPQVLSRQPGGKRSRKHARTSGNNKAATNGTAVQSATPTYTIDVAIDLLLQTQVDEVTKVPPPLPPVGDVGAWVTVTGYTTAEGGVQAIVMVRETKVDLEGYERGVRALAKIRERAERAVAEGVADGAAVAEGQWDVV